MARDHNPPSTHEFHGIVEFGFRAASKLENVLYKQLPSPAIDCVVTECMRQYLCTVGPLARCNQPRLSYHMPPWWILLRSRMVGPVLKKRRATRAGKTSGIGGVGGKRARAPGFILHEL